MTLMFTSQEGIDLIKKFEELRLEAYLCPAGVWTIGWGTTTNVKKGMKITKSEAESYLRRDIQPIEKALNSLNINFTQNQFDAIVSWIYNIGIGKFNSSTLKKKILAKAPDLEITDQIIKWVNAGGKPLLGLKRRRRDEANLFLNGNIYYLDSNNNIKR